jgi:hypothetical protein
MVQRIYALGARVGVLAGGDAVGPLPSRCGRGRHAPVAEVGVSQLDNIESAVSLVAGNAVRRDRQLPFSILRDPQAPRASGDGQP